MSLTEGMVHAQIQTTQKYLHTLHDADERALAAFHGVRTRTTPRVSGSAPNGGLD